MADSYTYMASTMQPAVPGFSGLLKRSPDDAYIPLDLGNADYQAFLAWMAEGNPAPEGWPGMPTNSSG